MDKLAALEKVLASASFRQTGRLSRFLRFAVESAVRGESDRIKEYVVGVEVFDRPTDYDPQTDPVVRVEARRLRAKLLEYYSGEGAADPVRIEFPKGGYVPVFHQTAPVQRRVDLRPAAAVVAVALVAAVLLLRGTAHEQRIAVLPMRAYDEAVPEDLKRTADAFAEQVTMELARKGLPIVPWPTAFAYRTAGKSTRDIARELGVDAIAVVWARGEPGRIHLGIHLVDPSADRKLWAESFPSDQAHPAETARLLTQRLSRR